MRTKLPRPSARQDAFPGQAPSPTIEDLQGWFVEPKLHASDLARWESEIRVLIKRWKRGARLTKQQIEFLAIAATSVYDTTEDMLGTAAVAPANAFAEGYSEIRQIARSRIDRERVQAVKSFIDLEHAFCCQISEAENARNDSRAANSEVLKNFYRALLRLKIAVKKHSGTPTHRPRMEGDRDRAIYEMRAQGRTFGQIALDLVKKNPEWQATRNQAQRAYERYREREHTFLLKLFRMTFEQPPNTTPR